MRARPTFELKRLRVALALLSICVIGSAYFCYAAFSYQQNQKAIEEGILSDMRAVQKRQRTDSERRRIDQEYSKQFAKLDSAGYFTKANKLDWVEQIETGARELRIPLSKYELNEHSKMPLPIPGPADGLGLYKTPLNLELTMLHEGDLLALEYYLAKSNLGLFTFESCELRRTRDKPSLRQLEAMLSAQCQINIYKFVFDDSSGAAGVDLAGGMPAPDV
ncbi:MAG: hypothetical protein AB8B48_00950 [Pseudomonadales bacterium]